MPFFSPLSTKEKSGARASRRSSVSGAASAATAAAAAAASAGPAAGTLSDGPEPSLQGEWGNMWLLLVLYFLQGIPIGLASSIPLLLSSKGASYADQALYAFSSWPYSLKWLWAPVVDAVHTRRWGLGKRKAWVVPCQLATGVVMMVLASRVDKLLPGSGTAGAVDVPGLLCAFLALYFLVATQDIAVDGWALELLRPENVGYASTANTVGQGVGIQTAFSIFLALDSADVCNAYIRPALGLQPSSQGMLSLGGFLWGWGAVFLGVTLALWALKEEGSEAQQQQQPAVHAAPAAVAAVRGALRPSRSSSSAGATASSASSSTGAGEAEFDSETEALVASAGGLRERKKSASRSGSEEEKLLAAHSGSSSSSSSSGGAGSVLAASEPSSRGSGSGARAVSAAAATAAGPPSAPGAAPSTLAALQESYQDFYSVCFLPNILSLALVLLTFKAGFASVDATTTFVMQERGIPKETLAFIDTVSFPLQLCVQIFFIATWTAGPKALDIFLWAFPLRAASGLGQLAMVYLLLPNRALAPWTSATIPASAVAVIFVLSNAHSVVQSIQFMAQMSFFSRVAKQSPASGATVMTLLNALTNLGAMWPRPLILWAMQALTTKQCLGSSGAQLAGQGVGACNSAEASDACKALGGLCASTVSGYPVVVALGTLYCLAWWLAMRGRVAMLAHAPASGWALAK